MLITGDVAPAIELPETDMNMRSLAGFAGSWVVLYFYPKDDWNSSRARQGPDRTNAGSIRFRLQLVS